MQTKKIAEKARKLVEFLKSKVFDNNKLEEAKQLVLNTEKAPELLVILIVSASGGVTFTKLTKQLSMDENGFWERFQKLWQNDLIENFGKHNIRLGLRGQMITSRK
jgi:hypothetical protein